MGATSAGKGEWDALIPPVRDLVKRAGARILEIRARGFEVRDKADLSPVTEADLASEEIILPVLQTLTPEIPVVSEEAVAAGHIPDVSGGAFWLVDPLDGTREFSRGGLDFTVNVGLVRDGVPVLGVLGVPARDQIYAGASAGSATLAENDEPPRPIAARVPAADGLVVVASRSHGDPEKLDAYLAGRSVKERISAGSALKLGLVANGKADLYPRFGRTMEWDTAAGHAILLAAGGTVETTDGAPLVYRKPDFENPHFIAFGRR